MDTLEDRNLNRLRKGKMMLEFEEVKKSYSMAFVLALFFGGIGAHRFYLGHKLVGVCLLCLTAIYTYVVFAQKLETLLVWLSLYWAWIVVEIFLAPYFTGRVNRQIKADLMEKYGVDDYSVV